MGEEIMHSIALLYRKIFEPDMPCYTMYAKVFVLVALKRYFRLKKGQNWR